MTCCKILREIREINNETWPLSMAMRVHWRANGNIYDIYDIYTSVYMMSIYNIGWDFQCIYIYIYTTSIYSSKPIHASPGLQSFQGWSFW